MRILPKKLLLNILIISSCLLAGKADAAGMNQQYKDQVTALKNRRDQEIAALIRQRDTQILALDQQMRQIVGRDIAQIKKDKSIIEQRMRQGQNMKRQLQALMQQEQAILQKSNALQAQINKIKLTYDQQIQKITQNYSQVFANLQKQMMSQ